MVFGSGSGVEPAADYDRFVDWRKRLAREGPFFERLFTERGVGRVIDVGCGTGRHAVLFASWGLSVVGVDPSPSMLAQARIHAAERGMDVDFIEAGFGDLVGLGLGPADAIICTGNALPHVEDVEGLRTALTDFAGVLRPGGIAVLHLLNHERLAATGRRSMPPVVRDDEDGTWVFLRVLDHVEGGIRFDFVTLRRPVDGWQTGEAWEVTSRRSLHTALPASLLVDELGKAGFERVDLFGDHSGKQFDEAQDESVIVVAVRA